MNPNNPPVVLADGCFDPLHLGHIQYLKVAASIGTVIVNVAPDEAIRAKGREPFQACYERCETIRALKYVSDVRAGALAEAIKEVRPQFLLKGRQWSGGLPSDVLDACKDCGAIILYSETQARSSTDRLMCVNRQYDNPELDSCRLGPGCTRWKAERAARAAAGLPSMADVVASWPRDGKWFIDRH